MCRHEYADTAVAEARARGAVFQYSHAISTRGNANAGMGRIPDCRADAEAALEALQEVGVPLGALVEALTRQGRIDEAQPLLDRSGLNGHLQPYWINAPPDRPRPAPHRPGPAARRTRRLPGMRCPDRGPQHAWTRLLSLAVRGGARPRPARPRRRGPPARRGGSGTRPSPGRARDAGRRPARPRPGHRRSPRLRSARRGGRDPEAVASPVSVRAGARRRGLVGIHCGRVTEGRADLQEAASIAHACGADGLAEAALRELRALGDRPRTRTFQGVEALTPTERRVAALAVEGMTNRQIAELLFVGLRTVEIHLTHVYAKLGIKGRRELAGALD